MLSPSALLSSLRLSPSRLGGSNGSPERQDGEHGPRPVRGAGPCPAAVSSAESPWVPHPRPFRVTCRNCQAGLQLTDPLLPVPSRWLLLGAVTAGLLAQGVLAVSPGSRSRAVSRALGSGRDTEWPSQKGARTCSLGHVCVWGGGALCPSAAPTQPKC